VTHDEAILINAVEQYLLGELPPPLPDAFEEHYFDCPECAQSLWMAVQFAAGLRIVYSNSH
jgi:anti-sigma factor RsiW